MKANINQYIAITHTCISSEFKLNNSWNEQMPQENRCEQAFVWRNGILGISNVHIPIDYSQCFMLCMI